MPPRICPLLLTNGYNDGWPESTPVGMFLQQVRIGNTASTAALVAGLDPEQVGYWSTTGARLLSDARGEMAKVNLYRRPFVAFAIAMARAEADAESLLTSVVMDAALAETKDSWRAAAWLMDHRVVANSAGPELDDDDDDDADLFAAVRLPEDE